jgi:hypothetical protein
MIVLIFISVNLQMENVMKLLSTMTLAMAVTLATGAAQAATAAFDFNSGVGSDFSIINESGLFKVTTRPSISISKAPDDGTIVPTDFIGAGIRSNFALIGNFSVTVDFSLTDFPLPNQSQGLNESLLTVLTLDNQSNVSVLRYTHPQAGNMIEGWATPAHYGVGTSSCSLMSGRYQLQRSGDTIAVSFANSGSSLFTRLGEFNGLSKPLLIQLYANQGINLVGSARSATSLDVSFDNLLVVADQIQSIPEPSTLALLGIGAVISLFVWRRHPIR